MKISPEQFEQLVAQEYNRKGYDIQLTPRSYDYGVDIIARKESESIAIQVKMYESRVVNYKDVMYLYAGKDYYDCDNGILITSGICDRLAIQVAKKLGIVVLENHSLASDSDDELKKTVAAPNSDFDSIWRRYFIPLKGQAINTATGEKNTIIDVTGDYLERISSNGRKSKIEKQIFKTIYYRLVEKKSITRAEINTEYTSRGSAIIAAVFGRLPFITLTDKPVIAITLKYVLK